MLNTACSLGQAWSEIAKAAPGEVSLIHDEHAWSYAELYRHSCLCRAHFDQLGIGAGERVVLMLDNGPNFLAAFMGCQLAGIVPVPVSPKSSVERLSYLLTDSAARLVLIDRTLSSRSLAVHAQSAYGNLLSQLPEPSSAAAPVDRVCAAISPECCAFMQYTSGSTGDSKGVMISHRAVLTNINGFTAKMALDARRDVFSSLLPLFHDMGLVCFGLAPLLLGMPLVLYRQEALSLYRWLEGIGHHQVTVSGAPDSLLHLANRVVAAPKDYRLDSLRLLICGSEPVRAATVNLFAERFAVRHAIKPAYGMAELTLCATLTAVDESLHIDSAGHVASGRAIPGVALRIRTDDGMQAQQPGTVGEILVASPAAMLGYWNKPEATTAVVTAEGYIATGDFGYLDADGHLFVLGRLKNLLIRGGEKYSPHDLESTALAWPEVRRAAVVQIDDATQQIVAVLEVDRLLLKDPSALAVLGNAISQATHARCGLVADQYGFVPSGAIPATENGKTRHLELRRLIANGQLQPHWTDLARGVPRQEHHAAATA